MGMLNLGVYDKKYRISEEFTQHLEKISDLWKSGSK